MITNFLPRPARAALLALAVIVSTVSAQAQVPAPSANAIAAAVRFLASEEAGYITGHVLAVNGGMYM